MTWLGSKMFCLLARSICRWAFEQSFVLRKVLKPVSKKEKCFLFSPNPRPKASSFLLLPPALQRLQLAVFSWQCQSCSKWIEKADAVMTSTNILCCFPGFIGFMSCFLFVRKIYSIVKVDWTRSQTNAACGQYLSVKKGSTLDYSGRHYILWRVVYLLTFQTLFQNIAFVLCFQDNFNMKCSCCERLSVVSCSC